MFTSILSLLALPLTTFAAPATQPNNFPEKRAATVQGFDVSHYQPTVDFQSQYLAGARFAILKATESTSVVDQVFSSHWSAARAAHYITGAYHFAHPDKSSGAQQATFFLAHGGKWTNDGVTLPGWVDLEYDPVKGSNQCHGLTPQAMVAWIQDFVTTYQAGAGRAPGIYTTANWWSACTGNSKAFTAAPLWIARPSGGSPGTIPGGWGGEAVWQNSKTYGPARNWDGDLFNGDLAALRRLASPNNTAAAGAQRRRFRW